MGIWDDNLKETTEINNMKVFESVKAISRSNLADDVFYKLRELIISGKLKPGSMLPGEIKLSEYMGVGRSTLREALRALSTIGLIKRTKRGTYVNDEININEILPFPEILKRVHSVDIIEFRRMLETEIVALAAQRALDEDIENLKNWLKRMRESKTMLELTEADASFHYQLAAASQNVLLQNTYEMIRETLEKHIYDAFCNNPELKWRAISFHEKILAAIENEDAKAARKIIEEHISDVGTSLGIERNNTQ